jgi:hypothetical protein
VSLAGGVDNYLLETPDDRLQSEVGVRLRKILQRTLRESAAATSSAAAGAQGENNTGSSDAALR